MRAQPKSAQRAITAMCADAERDECALITVVAKSDVVYNIGVADRGGATPREA